MLNLFHTVFYQPLYNGLVFLISVIPWADAGIAVVVLTCLVKLVLFPLSRKAIHVQVEMKKIEPELAQIREKYSKNREEQARQIMALYKEKKVNPFSGFFLILIQFPIIIALYQIFLSSGLPMINTDLLYSFITTPSIVNINFLNLINISEKNIILAIIAAITTYFQIKLSVSLSTITPEKNKNNFANDLMRGMQTQMKYVFPFVVFFIASNISGAVSLYWVTSNLFTIAQELVVRRKIFSKKDSIGTGVAVK